MTPQESGNENPADKKPSEKRAGNPKKNFVSPNKNKRTKSEVSLTITGLFVVIIEISGLVLWQMADIFHGWKCDLVHWLSIDCFIAGAAIAAHKALNRVKLVWISYAVICAVVGFVIVQNSRPLPPNPAESKPAGWMPPELPENCQDVTLIWGGNFFGDYVSKARNTNLPINIQGVTPFSIRVENNRLYIDCNFFTQDYGFIQIRRDSISPQLPQKWDMNTSSNALEIVNENGTPVFQLFYRRPDEVAINGVFQIGGMVWFASDKTLEHFGTNNDDFIKASRTNFKELTDRTHPIFKYPAWNHKGQMVENPN